MSEKANFFRLTLGEVSSQQEDLLSALCFEYGALGISEDLDFVQTNLKYEPETLKKSSHQIQVFFSEKPSEEFFIRLETQFPAVVFSLNEEENRDWLEEWKKGYKSFSLVGDVWVVPSWLTAPSEATHLIKIDPGMAFGTGTHETTQLAAELLAAHFKGGSLLDVGTGTGILAILAEILGATSVVGTEIDPVARSVARENIQLNQSKVQIVDEQIESLKEPFDWVVANIIDGVLLELRPDLIRLASHYLVLTGILSEREAEFRSEWEAHSAFQVVERRQKGEWVGFLLRL